MLDNIKKTNLLLNRIYKKKLSYLFLLTIFNVLVEFVTLSLLASFIIVLNDPEVINQKINSEFILSYLNSLSFEKLIIYFATILFFAVILKNIINLGTTYFELSLKKKLVIYNFEKLYSAFLKSDYLYIVNKNPSELVNKLQNIIPKAVDTIFFYFLIFKESLITIFLLSLIFITDTTIFLFLLAIFGIIIFLFFKNFRKKLDYYSKLKILNENKILQIILETANNFKIIKLLNKNEFFKNNLIKNIDLANSITMFKNFLDKVPKAFFEISLVTVLVALFVFLIYQDLDFKSFVPTIVLLCISFLRLLPSFSNITAIRNSINFHRHDVLKFLEEIDHINDNDKTVKLLNFSDDIDSIELKNINFKYNDKSKFSLKNINIHLSKNNIYCFVGKSGSGKSTLVDIVTGLIDNVQGKININNKDVSIKGYDWKSKVSYVPQNIYLTDNSIIENITIGEDVNSINKQKFNDALNFAELTEFINTLHQKEHTKVGDAGKQISGGQKQRIGIARAIYKENNILIFDEATNALDINNENKIMEKLKKIKNDKIILIVAHSKNVARYCDKMIVLENGEISKTIENNQDFNTQDLDIYFDKN